VDALGGVVGDQFGGGIVGMEFNLVNGGNDFGGGVVEEDFEVLNTEIGDADVANFAGCGEFLEFLPEEVLALLSLNILRVTDRGIRRLTRS
jgi:hypothetical protein